MTTLLTKKKKNPTSCHISGSPHQSTAWITEIFFNSSFTISSNLGKDLWVQGVVWVYSIFYKANEHEADSAVEHKFGKAIGSWKHIQNGEWWATLVLCRIKSHACTKLPINRQSGWKQHSRVCVTVGYAMSENFLISENCYLLQFSVSAKLPNVGGLCSAVTGDMRLQISLLLPHFLEDLWFLTADELEISNRKYFFFCYRYIWIKKKKSCHIVSSSPG